MGLDMYAYTIDSRLLDAEHVTDVNPYKLARRAVGFTDVIDAELAKMKDEDVKVYFAKRSTADQRAKNEDWFNPDFYYWRKFNALHAWMGELYTSKGGTDPDFNCNTVVVTLDDLDQLLADAGADKLKPTAGFFWGNADEIEPEDMESVAEFVALAKEAIASGKTVIYDSWW